MSNQRDRKYTTFSYYATTSTPTKTVYRDPHVKHRRLALPRFRKVHFMATGGLLSLAILGFVAIPSFKSGEAPKVAQNIVEAQEKPVEPPKKTTDISALPAQIDVITKKYPYTTSVSVIDINSGTMVQTGDDYPFIAASTTKLLTALYFMSKVESGESSLDQQIGGKKASEQLRLMVNQSDNQAWQTMNAYLNKESLQTYANGHGFKTYDAQKNTLNSNDMAQMISKLYKNELVNSEHSKLILSWMQNTSEERFIPAAVPAGSQVFHKAGYLPERVHDVAIVDNGQNPYALVIFSKSQTNSYDYQLGQKLFSQVTKTVSATFNQ